MRERRRILKKANRAGWKVKIGSKHWKLYPPDGGRPSIMPRGKISERGRGWQNLCTELRRKGLDV